MSEVMIMSNTGSKVPLSPSDDDHDDWWSLIHYNGVRDNDHETTKFKHQIKTTKIYNSVLHSLEKNDKLRHYLEPRTNKGGRHYMNTKRQPPFLSFTRGNKEIVDIWRRIILGWNGWSTVEIEESDKPDRRPCHRQRSRRTGKPQWSAGEGMSFTKEYFPYIQKSISHIFKIVFPRFSK